MKLRLSIALVAAALLSACGQIRLSEPPQPPPGPTPAPAVRAVAVVVRSTTGQGIPGASCALDDTGAPHQGVSDATGYVLWPEVLASIRSTQVSCTADGYVPASEARVLQTAGNEDLAPMVLTPLLTSAGETGRVHVDGLVFRREGGSIFPWRGSTEFLLFARFLAGEDIQPVLTERIAAGANLVRVLGMLSSWGNPASAPADGVIHLFPQEHADYYDRLGAFLDLVAARGLRIEFVVFADAQYVMPDLGAERTHLSRVAGVLSSRWNGLLETGNEMFKNIPGGDATAAMLCRTVLGRGFPVASGAFTDWPPLRPCDYGTTHPERKDEWPRTAKDLYDLSSASGVPWVSDEPMGFAEVEEPGRRTTNVSDGADFAAAAALLGAGSTFHSNGGIDSVLWGPVQRAAAAAWFAASTWVPTAAQLAPYTRGDASGPCRWVGESFVAHDDNQELRSFGKRVGNEAWVVQIRTTRAHATACPGWRILDEPRRGFVHLVQP